jgi:peptide/nickel transport system substrate-binding protein
MRLKRILSLILVSVLFAALLAACGDTPTNTVAPTTARATTAAATTAAATTAATTAAATTSAATTAAATTAASTTSAATTAVATTVAATTSAATTAAATTAASTTPGGTGTSAIIENYKPDGTVGKKGGQLVFTFAGQFPSNIQPYYVNEVAASNILAQIWATPVGQTGNSKYYAYLATEVPTIENGGVKLTNGNTAMDITIKLKPNLKWSDGTPLTSKDFAYTHKWVLDPDNGSITSDISSWGKISEVQTPDANTVVLKFKEIYGSYLNFLTGMYPLPETVWGKIPTKDADKNPESTKPSVTSGPFKVEEYTVDDRIVLARNDNFSAVWGFSAYLDRVTMRFTADANAALAAITKGEIDVVDNVDDSQWEPASKVPNTTHYILPAFTYEFLQYNLTNPLFQDVKVRKAFDMAIDRAALIKQFRTPKTVAIGSPVPPISTFSDKSLQPTKYDPEGAKKMLDDAGWKVGADGIRAKDGKKLSFTLSSTTAPVRVSTAEVMLKYWKDIGVDAKFQSYKSAEFFGAWGSDGVLARGKYDVAMFAFTTPIDPDSSYANAHSSQIPTDANKGNGNNYGRLNDKNLDKLLDDQRATADQAKRLEIWKQIQKVYYDNTYESYLYDRVQNLVVANKVKNLKTNPTTDTNFWNMVEVYIQ